MAGKKRGGRDWKPGESGNPNGRPTTPARLKLVRAFLASGGAQLFERYASMTREQLTAAIKDPRASALELMLATVIDGTFKRGDPVSFGMLVDRMAGPGVSHVQAGGDEESSEAAEED